MAKLPGQWKRGGISPLTTPEAPQPDRTNRQSMPSDVAGTFSEMGGFMGQILGGRAGAAASTARIGGEIPAGDTGGFPGISMGPKVTGRPVKGQVKGRSKGL